MKKYMSDVTAFVLALAAFKMTNHPKKSAIIVNAVSPGYCNTPLLNNLEEQLRGFLSAQVPLGRLGTPEEIANLVVYLAADELIIS
jgi:NAD(P)-dependent dehydrogenase (short-subunit alcohol dehydrogenase family)